MKPSTKKPRVPWGDHVLKGRNGRTGPSKLPKPVKK